MFTRLKTKASLFFLIAMLIPLYLNYLRTEKEEVCYDFEVVIYDISGDFATAKTIVPKYNFFDYCQLAKYDGEWKIINILWGWLAQSKD